MARLALGEAQRGFARMENSAGLSRFNAKFMRWAVCVGASNLGGMLNCLCRGRRDHMMGTGCTPKINTLSEELVQGEWPTDISLLRTPDSYLTYLAFSTVPTAQGNKHYFNAVQFSSRPSRGTIVCDNFSRKFSKSRQVLNKQTHKDENTPETHYKSVDVKCANEYRQSCGFRGTVDQK